MNLYIKYLLSLPKSIYFNFRYLPIKQAVRMPFYIRYGTRLNIKGKVNIDGESAIRWAMIVIGSHEADISDPKHTTCITVEKNARLVFEHSAHIGLGSKIFVKEGASMYLGDNFAVSANSSFICYKRIIMGRDIQFSWGCQVMDSDTHTIIGMEGQRMNPDKEVRVGNKVWIGCNVMIMKGAIIPDNCVIGAESFVLGTNFSSNSIIVGSPAKSYKQIKEWKL